jgi:hypothetical protein
MLGECIFAAVSQGGVAGGEKNAAEVLPNDSSNENSHQSAGPNNDSPYPLHTTIMCCPHHSCMLSPISPIQHMPNQAVAAAGLARSCLSLHGHPASNCPYPPNSPLMYSSPMVYNPARRSSSARLQRWNSLDAMAIINTSHQMVIGETNRRGHARLCLTIRTDRRRDFTKDLEASTGLCGPHFLVSRIMAECSRHFVALTNTTFGAKAMPPTAEA